MVVVEEIGERFLSFTGFLLAGDTDDDNHGYPKPNNSKVLIKYTTNFSYLVSSARELRIPVT